MHWITAQPLIGNFQDAQAVPLEVTEIRCLRENCCEDRDDGDALSIPLIHRTGTNLAVSRKRWTTSSVE
jgi:hypothetical protein